MHNTVPVWAAYETSEFLAHTETAVKFNHLVHCAELPLEFLVRSLSLSLPRFTLIAI